MGGGKRTKNRPKGDKQASVKGAQESKTVEKRAEDAVKEKAETAKVTPKPAEKKELPKSSSKEVLEHWGDFDSSSCNLPTVSNGSNEKAMDADDKSWENSQCDGPKDSKKNLRSSRSNESEDSRGPTCSVYQDHKKESGNRSQNRGRGRYQDDDHQSTQPWRKDQSYKNQRNDGNRTKHFSPNRNNGPGDKERDFDAKTMDTNDKSWENPQSDGPKDSKKNLRSSRSKESEDSHGKKESGNRSQNRGGGKYQDDDHQGTQPWRKDYKSQRNDGNWNKHFSPNRNNEPVDKEYDEFWKSAPVKDYIKVQEIDEDLFAMPKEYSLAHCVAEDMSMGSGIAVQFSRDFKRRDELLQQREKQGGLAFLEIEQRFIYYLVTKRQSTGKPTMRTLWNSLQKMKNHIEERKVTKLAMPRIGCGLDRLEWSDVKAMVEYTFRNTEIEITVCNFQQPEDGSSLPPARSFKCNVRNVAYPLVQIEAYTAIVYFGTEDGFVTEDIQSLDTKFRILQDYKTATKTTGDVIRSVRNQNTFILYGFIVKKSQADLFGFTNLQKCINNFKKMNTKESASEYVGIQAFLDDDTLIMDKIVNILRYSLRGVEVYVCWPDKLAPFMPQTRRDNY